jgi:mono/diheme cytochrome c family protein
VALLNQRCAGCHNLDRVKAAKKDAAGWKATVERMVGKGAQASAAEAEALIKHLAETYR